MMLSSSTRGLRVETRRRLVEDRDLRVLHQDFGKPEPLAHAAREGRDALVRHVGEPDMRERSLDLLLALRAIEPHQPRGVAQILGGGEIVVEADLVGQIADPALDRERLAHGIMAEHAGLPVRNVAQAEQHQDGGGLAGAVRTEQPENLPARHRERNAVDDGDSVVALGEVLRLDDVVAHRRPNHTTAPIMTSSAPPMSAMPTMPHSVEVVTATRNDCDADSPRAAARTVVT